MTHVPLLLQCIIATPVKTLCSFPLSLSRKTTLRNSLTNPTTCKNILHNYVTTACATDHHVNISLDGSDLYPKQIYFIYFNISEKTLTEQAKQKSWRHSVLLFPKVTQLGLNKLLYGFHPDTQGSHSKLEKQNRSVQEDSSCSLLPSPTLSWADVEILSQYISLIVGSRVPHCGWLIVRASSFFVFFFLNVKATEVQ